MNDSIGKNALRTYVIRFDNHLDGLKVEANAGKENKKETYFLKLDSLLDFDQY
jgi:hypothetical protein